MDENVFGQSNCIVQAADQYTEDNQPTNEEIEASPVAVRADSGKDPWSLFMWDAAKEVVKVLQRERGQRRKGGRQNLLDAAAYRFFPNSSAHADFLVKRIELAPPVTVSIAVGRALG